MSCTGNDEQAICDQIDGGLHAKEQNAMSPFEDWWEFVGSNMKNEPGENMGDTELPLRVAKAAWDAHIKNHVLVKFESDDDEEIRFAQEWAENTARSNVWQYVKSLSNLRK